MASYPPDKTDINPSLGGLPVLNVPGSGVLVTEGNFIVIFI